MDEIDTQYEELINSKISRTSISGILSAIAGSPPLSKGTIVIMTANNKNFVQGEYVDKLFRQGRIDKIFEFRTQLNPKK